MSIFNLSTEYSTIVCCYEKCGMTFAAPTSWKKNRQADKKSWYCPNGHYQSYRGETIEKKLRKQIKFIEKENEACMLNLQRKNQDLVLLRMTDREELYIKEDGTTIHIKKSNGASEIIFMCGYKETSLFNKTAGLQEGQRLCSRCSRAMEIKNLEEN